MITLVHLYPREMNIYGDTGNVVVLRKRLEWRGRPVRVVPVSLGDPLPNDADILLGGGGQDAAQGEIGADFASRGAQLRAMADELRIMVSVADIAGFAATLNKSAAPPAPDLARAAAITSRTPESGPEDAKDQPFWFSRARQAGLDRAPACTRIGAP